MQTTEETGISRIRRNPNQAEPLNNRSQIHDDDAINDQSVIEAIRANTDLLHALMSEMTDVRTLVATDDRGSSSDTQPQEDGQESEAEQQIENLQNECQRLQELIRQLSTEKSELRSQNDELAARIAASKVHDTASADAAEASEVFSWEERKRLILMQMEEDSFDADHFAASLSIEIESGRETPATFIERLRLEIETRDQEIAELRNLLAQQAEARSDGIAIGASAIADMLDSDELIAQERAKLQQLQADWEEKFREGEIEASLERAKLSRERQEVMAKKQELQLQLEQLQREYRQESASGSSTPRRWLAKLGLAEDDS